MTETVKHIPKTRLESRVLFFAFVLLTITGFLGLDVLTPFCLGSIWGDFLNYRCRRSANPDLCLGHAGGRNVLDTTADDDSVASHFMDCILLRHLRRTWQPEFGRSLGHRIGVEYRIRL